MNLIHPAVLGTIIVNLIQAILTGTLFQFGAFPVLASIILVWYFVLDYWVTMTNFEDDPENYRLRYFILDIFILIILFGSFYALWSMHSDLWFFISLTVLVSLIILWSALLTGKFAFKDPIEKVQIAVLVFGIAPVLSSIVFPNTSAHLVLKYVALIATLIALFFYTKITLD